MLISSSLSRQRAPPGFAHSNAKNLGQKSHVSLPTIFHQDFRSHTSCWQRKWNTLHQSDACRITTHTPCQDIFQSFEKSKGSKRPFHGVWLFVAPTHRRPRGSTPGEPLIRNCATSWQWLQLEAKTSSRAENRPQYVESACGSFLRRLNITDNVWDMKVHPSIGGRHHLKISAFSESNLLVKSSTFASVVPS